MGNTKNFKLYIDGKWGDSTSGETFRSNNPAKPTQILGIFQKGNKEDVDRAVQAAEKALEKWEETPAPKRGLILLKTAQLLRENKEELARELTMEMGKVLVEARGDVQEAIDIAEYMAGEGRRLYGFTTPSELEKKFCMTLRTPIGVCGLITPWNFPIAIPALKITTALICGNTIVFKPSSETPLCATRLVQTLELAGLPRGVLNMVTGPGDAVGMSIAKDPKVKVISFTGHKDTGATILREAGLKKVGLEMGGKNGIIVHRKIKEKVELMLVNRIRKLKVGNGLDSDTDVGPLVNEAAQKKSAKFTRIGIRENAKLLVGGRIPKMEGFYFEPTLFTDCSIDMRIAQEEIFGPIISLISVKDFEEAIEAMNSIEYGLSSSIYTKSVSKALKAITKIEAGIVYINSSTIGAEVHLPFGGTKHTGIGTREGGIEGINEFSETKTVYIDYSGKLQKAQIDHN